MVKHNGKARKAGLQPGAALANRHKVPRGPENMDVGRHTTEAAGNGVNMQSVIDRNDLSELMHMADLSGRDFTAERSNVIVLSSSAMDPRSKQHDAEHRLALEKENAHLLHIPRRPSWEAKMTSEQLDQQERAAFLEWRRSLAKLEEVDGLVLTPFEKNLEVWRQLWRVLERSDIVIQVVDARDPLLYWDEDLTRYAAELDASKRCIMLLNKADLLPEAVRSAWSAHLRAAGVQHAFWSAHAAMEAQQKAKQLGNAGGPTAAPRTAAAGDAATHILDADELLEWMEARAAEALAAAPASDPRHREDDRRFMVGLVGYPNVGKSSTINALFGSKKTAVAPTPGKTKHFQTLNVSATLCLCDCPGLVMPRFAKSRAEMVAAGVIPIDRLTDVRAPVGVLVERCSRQQFEEVYTIRLNPQEAVTAASVLRALGYARGWTANSGLPDETRAGRQLLKDYASGKLVHCMMPPAAAAAATADAVQPPADGPQSQAHEASTSAAPPAQRQAPLPAAAVAAAAAAGTSGASKQPAPAAAAAASTSTVKKAAAPAPGADSGDEDEESEYETDDDEDESEGDEEERHVAQAHVGETAGGEGPAPSGPVALTDADLDLLSSMGLAPKAKPKRPEHKFQKKARRQKGTRGMDHEDGGYDGAALRTGKKGGLVRVGGY